MREGSKIFVLMPDGERVELSGLQAAVHVEMWNDVLTGAYVAALAEKASGK
ncbi:MAG: hypothetical protein KGL39_46260 [Patescibacteria group bacterium]|nr:hypothetical protein [Patescibacteria group bacterium]